MQFNLWKKSFRKVAAETGIPKATLKVYNKIFDSQPTPTDPLKKPWHGNRVLTVQQEDELADYLIATNKGYTVLNV